MEVLRIRGGKPLQGNVEVSGAKNAALPILAACLLTKEEVTLTNVPQLSDVRFMISLLEHLGAEVDSEENTVRVRAKNIQHVAPYDLVRKMRASVCLMGPLLGRLRKAKVSLPGGCVIGPRPIDLHLKGFAKLGCKIDISGGDIFLSGEKMRGNDMFLGGRHGSTVTGTANLLMAAVLTPGVTRIESAACEPEVCDLCHLLVKMGAKISGIGSHMLTIEGVEALHGCEHKIIYDRIEAGTFLLAGAVTGGDVTVTGAEVSHQRALVDKMEEANLPLQVIDHQTIRFFTGRRQGKPVDVITLPHPGFPTDVQAQFCALMALTPGLSIVTERIYPNRFMHVPELQRMGADISIEGPSAIIKGGANLSGAPVMASDLRASAALVLAGLAASGETWVQRIYHLDRGYDRFDEKLATLGADIVRLPDSEMPESLKE